MRRGKNENVERMGFGKLTLINFLACKLALEGEGGWVMSCTQQMHALTAGRPAEISSQHEASWNVRPADVRAMTAGNLRKTKRLSSLP